MTRWLVALLLLAPPFWEVKDPKDWTNEQVNLLLNDSPWARNVGAPCHLATALPMREAERQRRLRSARLPDQTELAEAEYEEYLRDNPGRFIVLAIYVHDLNTMAESRETARMENESVLRFGKQKLKMVGHFPATPADPYLRMIFPRVEPKEKSLNFDLYLPMVTAPWRQIEFQFSEMKYRGRLEY